MLRILFMEKNIGIHLGSSPSFSTSTIVKNYQVIIDKDIEWIATSFYIISRIMEIQRSLRSMRLSAETE